MSDNAIRYRITVGGNDQGLPAIDAEVGRVTVILGANGSGKTRLIEHLATNDVIPLRERQKVVVEGNRVLELPARVASPPESEGQMRQKQREMKRQRQSQRLQHAMSYLHRLDSDSESMHSRAVTAWHKGGQQGECPKISESWVGQIFAALSEILPHIKADAGGDQNTIQMRRGGEPYTVKSLSDGEKMVFGLLIDLETTVLTDPNSVFLVDELELHLQPALASRLWTAIEDRLPASIFVYATHCISFAMRKNVDTVIALRLKGPAMTIHDIGDLPRDEVREFLGSIAGILSGSSALVVEGPNDSFDCECYRWLLDDQEITVVGVEGCENVIAATKRTGIWNQLAPGVIVHGVIDRDFHDATFVKNRETDGCSVLDYHEAESYLCHPKIVADLAAKLGTARKLPIPGEVAELIRAQLTATLLRVAAQRTFQRVGIRLGVSLDRKNLMRLAMVGDKKGVQDEWHCHV